MEANNARPAAFIASSAVNFISLQALILVLGCFGNLGNADSKSCLRDKRIDFSYARKNSLKILFQNSSTSFCLLGLCWNTLETELSQKMSHTRIW